jgi:hypothetical protein
VKKPIRVTVTVEGHDDLNVEIVFSPTEKKVTIIGDETVVVEGNDATNIGLAVEVLLGTCMHAGAK